MEILGDKPDQHFNPLFTTQLQALRSSVKIYVHEPPRLVSVACPPEVAVNTEVLCEATLIDGNAMHVTADFGDGVTETFAAAGQSRVPCKNRQIKHDV